MCLLAYLGLTFTKYAYLIVLVCVLVLFLAWKFISRFYIEFEYSLTNGILDIDKIVNKKKRKRLLTTECKTIESYGKYDAQAHRNRNYRTRIFAANPDSKNLFCIICSQENKGTTLVVLEPDKRMREALTSFLPRQAVNLDDGDRH